MGLGVSNWDGILGSLSESFFHWGPGESQKGISNRILLVTPTLGAFQRLLQEAATAQQALSPPNQAQLKPYSLDTMLTKTLVF